MRICLLAAALLLLASPAQAEDDILYFRTPSANIHCMAWNNPSPYIRCDILQIDAEPGPTRDCPVEEGLWGHSFLLEEGGSAQAICTNDAVVSEASPVLQYGESFSYGSMSCTSERQGLTCENADGGGFSLSRASQEAY